MKRYLPFLFLMLFAPAVLAQGPPDSASLVRVSATAPPVVAGKTVDATVTLSIQTGWHINSNKPAEDFLRPTIVSVRSAGGIKPGSPRYPAAKTLTLQFSETPMSVFEGKVPVLVPLTITQSAKPGVMKLKGTVDFQPCNATSCFAPATVPFSVNVTVKAPPGAKVTAAPTAAKPEPSPVAPVVTKPAKPVVEEPAQVQKPVEPKPVVPAPAPPDAGVTPAPVPTPAEQPDPWSHALETRGLLAFLALIFVAGLALNLTPCVYPMIAVTMSIFGARAGETRGKVTGKAMVYVLGMATMYTALGLFAAMTGSLFGGVLQSVWVQAGIGVFLLALALGMFGVYEMQVPPKVAAALGGANRGGLLGIYLSGLVVGIFAAPCVGPVVLGLLAMVGAKRDIGFGAISFFTLALGLGAPYLVLASSTSLLGKLPRSGGWMETVKHVFGLILVSVAVRYFVLAFTPAYVDIVTPLSLIAGGLYIAFLDRHAGESARFRLNKRILSLLAVVIGVYLTTGAWNGIRAKGIDTDSGWTVYSDELYQRARAEGRPIVLDFGASWCAACKELEHITFKDPNVVDALKPFELLRVELDGANRAQEAELRKKWNVKGLPDVIFVNSSGEIVSSARVGGFLPPDRFIEKIKLVNQ